jgi:flagellar assembly protein FliH
VDGERPLDESAEGVSAPSVSAHETDLQAESLKRAMEAAKQQQETEMRAAYDELITTAQDEVSMLLEDARAEVQTKLREAQLQSEEIRHKAYETGLNEGYERAGAETADILRKAQEEADSVLAKAEAERQRIIDETQPKMYRLALDIAEKILKYELEANSEAYMGILTAAMNRVKTEGQVTLRVNTAEYLRFFNGRSRFKLRTEEGTVDAEVITDPSVEPGGVLIETDSGVVDASVAAQLEQITQGLGVE